MSASRREFLQGTMMAGAVTMGGMMSSPVVAAEKKSASGIAPGAVVLFQGDSITDTGRSRETAGTPNLKSTLGNGYAWLAGSQLLVDSPEAGLKVFNRGISGNKVFQLASRWDEDCLNLKPDVLSILIGVNDIWHKINKKYDGTVETYLTDYQKLVERTKAALPKVKLVICEPFVLRCGAVNDAWFPEFDKFRAAARQVAEESQALFVPFQTAFDEAVKYAPPEVWAKDGVHPTGDGAALMAHTWLRTVAAQA
jgi:lysophospholipase L1-like esterase